MRRTTIPESGHCFAWRNVGARNLRERRLIISLMEMQSPDHSREPIGRIGDRLAIERLNADFGHELDRGTADGFTMLFTPDALYTNGSRILRGHDAIRNFYTSRSSAGPRTSRHVVTGLRIDFDSPADARGLSVCMTFSMPGEPEIPSTMPAIVADFDDRYVRINGGWLISVRHIVPIFRAPPAGG